MKALKIIGISLIYLTALQAIKIFSDTDTPDTPNTPLPPSSNNNQRIVQAVKDTFSIDATQERNINLIIDAFYQYGDGDKNKLFYILASVRHESRFKPVRECFATSDYAARNCVKNRSYGYVTNSHVYYGRGFIQITWDSNYIKMTNILGIDLYNYPDKALKADIAAEIAVYGMLNGTFTGKKLSDYINANGRDYYNARRIVNGTDKATLIKSYTNDMIRNYNKLA